MVKTKMKLPNNKRRNNKKLLLIGLAVLLLVAAGSAAYWYSNRNNSQTDPSGIDPPGTEKIDLSPPTEEDMQAVDDNKEKISQQEDQANQAPPTGRSVTPTIVDASYYDNDQVFELRAYVSGVFESTGTCKVTLTKGSDTIMRESAGFKDATHTSCTPISIPRSDFSSSGDWKVTLSYNSPAAQGSTQPKTVRIE